MTPSEFKTIRRTLGFSASKMAAALGVADGRTIRRWEAGSRSIPGTIVRLLEYLLAEKPGDST